MRKRGKPQEIGSVTEIALPNGQKAYGRVLKSPLMAFYAVLSDRSLGLQGILGRPVAFKVWVMRSAVTSGRWPVIGFAPLEPEFEASPWFFKHDPISKALTLYQEGVERPASKEECVGLERASVWSAEHVESRLQDQLEGRPNKWVEMLKLKA